MEGFTAMCTDEPLARYQGCGIVADREFCCCLDPPKPAFRRLGWAPRYSWAKLSLFIESLRQGWQR